MRMGWNPEDLIDCWTLVEDTGGWLADRRTRLGFASSVSVSRDCSLCNLSAYHRITIHNCHYGK